MGNLHSRGAFVDGPDLSPTLHQPEGLKLGTPRSTKATVPSGKFDVGAPPYSRLMRTPIRISPDPMYAEFEVHRTMIRDQIRTEAFKRAIEAVVRPGDVVLDVGAGSGVLSMFAARAGASRVYAVEQTSMAVLAQELVAANGLSDVIEVIQGDVMDIEPPGRVDVIVSEWLGGFGIDEGMLVPVIAARDRWLKPGGIMIPGSVTAWTALVRDRYLEETVEFLRTNPYGIDLEGLIERTVNEISYSGTFRHLEADDARSGRGRLWTTDAHEVPLDEATFAIRGRGRAARPPPWDGQRARALVQRRARARHRALHRTRRSGDALGNDDCAAAFAGGACARHGRPRPGPDGSRPTHRDMDALGHRAAGCGLGGA